MKPRVEIARTLTPDGGEMVLYQHDRDFTIEVDGDDLMLSRHHESELELARLGCAHLTSARAPVILIGGLGLGYTLRQALDMLGPDAEVIVCELLAAVVQWNREILWVLNDRPLADKRVDIRSGNVVELIAQSRSRFDAILLDVDNGPSALTHAGNSRLYGYDGILACCRALRHMGCLAVWSAGPCREYEQLLLRCGLHVRRYRVPAYKGSKSQSRFVWIASEDKKNLPPGGGEPRRPAEKIMGKGRRRK